MLETHIRIFGYKKVPALMAVDGDNGNESEDKKEDQILRKRVTVSKVKLVTNGGLTVAPRPSICLARKTMILA